MKHLSLLLLSILATAPVSASAQSPGLVIVVRHAERAGDPGSDPALTPAGEARAEALAAALRHARVAAVITTQFRRTQLTAAPLARAAGLTPLVIAGGRDTEAHARAVADSARARARSGAVLIVGHSNTVPAIIRALGGPDVGALCDTDYSNLFTLVLGPAGEATLVRGSYGAPDQPAPADCHR